MKILIVKKKHIYYFLFLIFLILFISFLIFNHTKSISTFEVTNDNLIKKADFNGDGKEDILYIKMKDKDYFIQININNNSLFFKPDKKLNTLGSYNEFWPMKIALKDISRDKTPEIIIQSSQDKNSIQHIFMWDKNDFKDIFCSRNNVFGFLDTTNNKTPKMISGMLNNDGFNFQNYILINDKLQPFNIDKQLDLTGSEVIRNVICCIESFPNTKINLPNYIIHKETTNDLYSALSRLNLEKRFYNFQDALFSDTKSTKDGNALEIKWKLNFRGTSVSDTADIKNYTINAVLRSEKQDDNLSYKFKITNLYLE